MKQEEIDGATPLTEEEREGLILSHITTRAELNVFESMNVLSANEWLKRRRRREILTVDFICLLHKKMFGDAWKWAGQFRTTDKNIGIPKHMIRTELHKLLEDCKVWIESGTYMPDEIAIRLHHRLVAIHPFPNGNGRHARKVADLLAIELKRPPFTWGGGGSLGSSGQVRNAYIDALREADNNYDYTALLAFARS